MTSNEFAEGVLRDLENVMSGDNAGEIVPQEPDLPRSWILERSQDEWTVDLALHRCARCVPERYRDSPVEVPGKLREVITRWGRVPGACLYFSGPVGRGKTQLAWVAALSWLATYRAGAWPGDLEHFAVPHLFEELRRSFDSRGGTDIVGRCVRSKLLFLDDFGAENVSEWTRERMLEIVNERYDHKRSMIVTSNLAPDELEASQEPRLVSRLTQMCEGFVVHVSGPDRRRGGQAGA